MKTVFKHKRIIKKIFKRIISFLFALFILSVLVFWLARLAPGDPLQSFYGDQLDLMSDEEIDMARERLGLNDSLPIQYIRWLSNAANGDFGISFKYKMPVLKVVGPLIGNSLLLGITAYVVIFILATLLAVFCVLHEDKFIDKLICRVGTILYYTPGFWLGVVLVLVFSINLGWFPSSGAYDVGKANDVGNRIKHMVLPLTVMIASHLWYYAYMIRNKLLDEVRKDYVLLAKVKGCSKREILWKHCLRNVAPTIVSIMAISIPHVTGGTVVVESVFNYPGIGGLAVESAKYHDYNLLMVVVLITGIAVLAAGLIAQSVNEEIDPRMKESETIKW